MVSNMYACHKYNDEGLTSRLLMKQYVDIKPPYRKVALSLEKCSNTLNKSNISCDKNTRKIHKYV
uniref:Uncharacterized protein n=1 Tax=Anguilla anguilla TaxID=7936 RepID=A0A0E9QVN8_ANGAN